MHADIAHGRELQRGEIARGSRSRRRPHRSNTRRHVEEPRNSITAITFVYDESASGGFFTTKDPIRFAAGDTNLYAYAGSDPVNRIDPSGRFAQVIIFGVAIGVGELLSMLGISSGLACISQPEACADLAERLRVAVLAAVAAATTAIEEGVEICTDLDDPTNQQCREGCYLGFEDIVHGFLEQGMSPAEAVAAAMGVLAACLEGCDAL